MTEASKDPHFFDYNELARTKWRDILDKAQDKFKVSFDTENDDSVEQREIVIPQKEWDFTKCKFRCELRKAGGDWQYPVIYFRCQLIDGYAEGLSKYRGESMFCYIPGKKDGNGHLARCGKGWCAPDAENDSITKSDEKKCWGSLKDHLTELVNNEIEKVKAQRAKCKW